MFLLPSRNTGTQKLIPHETVVDVQMPQVVLLPRVPWYLRAVEWPVFDAGEGERVEMREVV